MSSRGEGAVIDRKARTVRLRHEPAGFVYELRGDGELLEVVRVDRTIGGEEVCGAIRWHRERWQPERGDSPAKLDAVRMVARAWSLARLLKPTEPAPEGSQPDHERR